MTRPEARWQSTSTASPCVTSPLLMVSPPLASLSATSWVLANSPPLSSTQSGPRAASARAARSMSPTPRIKNSAGAASPRPLPPPPPVFGLCAWACWMRARSAWCCLRRRRASWTFGVRTVASGRSLCRKALTALGSSKGSPEVETITGSTTARQRPMIPSFPADRACASIMSATKLTTCSVPSIPVLTTSVPKSWRTDCICALRNASGRTCTPCTPRLFWAVTAVMAVVEKTLAAAQAFISAWMPAPPPESDPATISTLGGTICPAAKRRCSRSSTKNSPAGGAAVTPASISELFRERPASKAPRKKFSSCSMAFTNKSRAA
mmetsp:Transcript_22883/g.51607  ORF Transcript_22883/g.51607 Transcript_22883/m.51607 type:complete len:323 (-) Transcript_22883:133-1101(-)